MVCSLFCTPSARAVRWPLCLCYAHTATENIISECCSILEADRATLFKLDPSGKELELMVAEGAKSIFLPVGQVRDTAAKACPTLLSCRSLFRVCGIACYCFSFCFLLSVCLLWCWQGIAGTVAATGEVINIPDAYEDARFDSSHDKATGYRTKTILCAPVKDGSGRIVGVIQAINRAGGAFTAVDQEILGILAAQAGIALRNAELYHMSVRSREKVRALLEIIKAMHSDLGINSLMFTITQRTHTIVDADRCSFFLVNHAKQELWMLQGDVDLRIPMSKGIVGAVATSGHVVNIPDAYVATCVRRCLVGRAWHSCVCVCVCVCVLLFCFCLFFVGCDMHGVVTSVVWNPLPHQRCSVAACFMTDAQI